MIVGAFVRIANSHQRDMYISERGQITIPKPLRDRYGMNRNVEVEIKPTEDGLLIRKRTTADHPVERVYGLLGHVGSTDDFT